MKKGTMFEHAKWLNPEDGSPLKCKVTRVAQGTVYYRPYYGKHLDGTEWFGNSTHFPVEMIGRYVAKIAADA